MAPAQASPAEIPEYLKQGGLSQECKDLIASLPYQRTWLGQQFHLYQGFWYATRILEAVLSFQKHFRAQDSDVMLATSLKSGTTWTKALIFALMNRGQYVNSQKHPLLHNNPHALILTMEFNVYGGRQPLDLSNLESPRLLSTHLPFVSLPGSVKESNCKIVYMGRNPKDTLISLWHFMNKLKNQSMENTSIEVAFDEFCKGETPFGPVWEHALGYWKESLDRPEKVLFLKFEDMKENPIVHTKRLAEFLGCPFSDEEEREGMIDDRAITNFDLKAAIVFLLMELDLQNPLLYAHDLHSDPPSSLFLNESDLMPSESYFRTFEALDFGSSLRTQIISIISQCGCNFDPLLSYLAVNYLDRFLSIQGIPQPNPWLIKLFAISCVSLAAKMIAVDYSLADLQAVGRSNFDTQTIQRMEFIILGALKWRMRSITPFSFIPFFVASLQLDDPRLLRALKARASDIIIRAQTEIKLLEFKPSVIAALSLLFASHELCPLQYPFFRKEISNSSYVIKENMNQCFNLIEEIVRMC